MSELLTVVRSAVDNETPLGIFRDDLFAWYRADQGVTLTSGKVSEWRDLSGKNQHLVQTGSTRRPSLNTANSSFNNQATIDFARANNEFLVKTLFPHIGQAAYIAIMASIPSGNTDQALFDYTLNSGFAAGLAGYYLTNAMTFSARDTVNTKTASWTTTLPIGATHFDFCYHNGGMTLYTNGTSRGTATPGALLNTLNRFTVGIMGNQSSYGLNGSIAEIIVVKKQCNAGERGAVRRYFQSRYRV